MSIGVSVRTFKTGIYPEITIRELLNRYPRLTSVLQEHFIGYVHPVGFRCSDCPLAGEETLAQAADAHGIIIDNLLQELTSVLEPGKNEDADNK